MLVLSRSLVRSIAGPWGPGVRTRDRITGDCSCSKIVWRLCLGFALASPTRVHASPEAQGEPWRASGGAPEHLLGAVLDTGIGPNRKGATAIGARFSRTHPSSGDGAALAWVGYGADLRAVTLGFDSIDGGRVLAVAEAGASMGAAGLKLEACLGSGVGHDGPVGVWGFGLMYSFYAFGFGLSFQFPVDAPRPAWLEPAQFAFRVRLPLGDCIMGKCRTGRAGSRSEQASQKGTWQVNGYRSSGSGQPGIPAPRHAVPEEI